MKKIMSIMLGLSLIVGAASITFAQGKEDAPKGEKGKGKGKGDKGKEGEGKGK
jgi:hypothetical protein